jgi:ankyrin repeat protein
MLNHNRAAQVANNRRSSCGTLKRVEDHVMNGQTFGTLLLVSILAAPQAWADKLHDAAKTGDFAQVKQLVEAGGNVDQRDITERTALSWAAGERHVEIAQFLLEKGADVNARDFANYTPLQHAVLDGDLAAVKLLVENGADVSVKDNEGVSVLDDAIYRRKAEMVTFLKASGAQCGTNHAYSC